MSSTQPRQVDHYRLEEKLGAGGMGVVYRAIDTMLDRPVAIKMLHVPPELGSAELKEAQERFLREAKAAARIRSRHVAQVLQLGTTAAGEAYIVMEYLQGETLSRLLARAGRLPASRAVAIARQICRGMQAAHELGVVHRDLKPANVMLVREEGEEVAKVLDFGVAKLTNDDQAKGLTQTGALVGTLPFMAPEQLTSSPVDNRTDVYALGIVLYRMLTGVPVWEVDSLADIVRHQTSTPPPSMLTRVTNPGFSPALDAVVLRCLEKSPARRWQTMRALSEALEAAITTAFAVPGTLPDAVVLSATETGEAPARPGAAHDAMNTALTRDGAHWQETLSASGSSARPSFRPALSAAAASDRPTATLQGRGAGDLPAPSLSAGVATNDRPEIRAPARGVPLWAAATVVVVVVVVVVVGGLAFTPSGDALSPSTATVLAVPDPSTPSQPSPPAMPASPGTDPAALAIGRDAPAGLLPPEPTEPTPTKPPEPTALAATKPAVGAAGSTTTTGPADAPPAGDPAMVTLPTTTPAPADPRVPTRPGKPADKAPPPAGGKVVTKPAARSADPSSARTVDKPSDKSNDKRDAFKRILTR
jgi:serine/threonine-protein kinase